MCIAEHCPCAMTRTALAAAWAWSAAACSLQKLLVPSYVHALRVAAVGLLTSIALALQLAVVMLALVIVGHVTYVGQAGCMPNAVASSLPPGVQTDDPSVLYSFVVTASDTDESVMGRYSFVEMSALAFLPQSVLTSHNFTT